MTGNDIENGATPSAMGGQDPSHRRCLAKKIGFIVVCVALLVVGVSVGVGWGTNKKGGSSSEAPEAPEATEEEAFDGAHVGSTPSVAFTAATTYVEREKIILQLAKTVNDVVEDLEELSTMNINTKYATCDDLRVDLVNALKINTGNQIAYEITWMSDYIDDDPMWGTPSPFTFAPTESPTTFITNNNRGVEDSSTEQDGGGIVATDRFFRTGSSTNNQEEAVDEADIVKSNGEQVFLVYGNEIVVMDVAQVNIQSRTKVSLEGDCEWVEIKSLLLIGERLVVLTSNYCSYHDYELSGIDIQDLPWLRGSVGVYVYNITDMSLISTETLGGSYRGARSIGDNVHIVTESWLDDYSFYNAYDPFDFSLYEKAESEEEKLELVTQNAQKRAERAADTLIGELDCTDTQKISLMFMAHYESGYQASFVSMTSVHSFSSLDLPGTLSSTNMFLQGDHGALYSSEELLVIGRNNPSHWHPSMRNVTDSDVAKAALMVFRFDGPSANPVALGFVDGRILNQFSIDHAKHGDKDYIRVASGSRNSDVCDGWDCVLAEDAKTQLTILEVNDGSEDMMPVTGKLEGLGKDGEEIFSVRYLDDRAFVVTFRYLDPFITLDLSDPTNPKKVGVLEIPGMSSYLHVVGDDLILGVGQYVDPETEFMDGLEISLFDVSDFANPQRISKFPMEQDSEWRSSEAAYDHKSFRFLEDSKILVLPVEDDNFGGFELYKVDRSDGIVLDFSVNHTNTVLNDDHWCYYYYYYTPPRSLVFGDQLMTIQENSVLTHNLRTKMQSSEMLQLSDEEQDCVVSNDTLVD